MDYLLYLYYVFAAFYVVLLPAYMLGRLLYPRERLAVRMGVGLVFVATVVPVVTFGLAMLFSTHMSEVLLFSVASVIIVCMTAVHVTRVRRKTAHLED